MTLSAKDATNLQAIATSFKGFPKILNNWQHTSSLPSLTSSHLCRDNPIERLVTFISDTETLIKNYEKWIA
jgi:hypothetical protein